MTGKFFYLLIITALFASTWSCQKELSYLDDGIITPVDQKPKVGTTWTYRYYTYWSYGPLATTRILVYKAKSEETLGGEQWLKIVDVDTDTIVHFLNAKTGGLFQFANSASNLLCKYPAQVNDTYTTFNEGAVEDFTVRGVNDTLATAAGSIPLSYYEGVKTGSLIDLIWFNENVWIVWKFQYYKGPPPANRYYLYSKMYLDKIEY